MLASLALDLIQANETHPNEKKKMHMFYPKANESKRTKYSVSVYVWAKLAKFWSYLDLLDVQVDFLNFYES